VKLPIACLIRVLPVSAAGEWVRAASDRFEIYSNASAKDARKPLEYFEQVRVPFVRVTSAEVIMRLAAAIVRFPGGEGLQALRGRRVSGST
jgi:hypothetical protein